jgi:hypothetical protein
MYLAILAQICLSRSAYVNIIAILMKSDSHGGHLDFFQDMLHRKVSSSLSFLSTYSEIIVSMFKTINRHISWNHIMMTNY